MQVKEVQRFEANGMTFNTREEALKYIAHSKEEKVMNYARSGNVLAMLNEMIKQGITNKNKMQNLIKKIESEQNDL